MLHLFSPACCDSALSAQVELDAEDEAAIRAMLAQRATGVRRLDAAAAPAWPENPGATAQPGARDAGAAAGPAPVAARAPKQAPVRPRLLAVPVKRKAEAGAGGGGGEDGGAAKRPATNGQGAGSRGEQPGEGGGALLGGLLGGYGSSNSEGSS